MKTNRQKTHCIKKRNNETQSQSIYNYLQACLTISGAKWKIANILFFNGRLCGCMSYHQLLIYN